MSGAQAVVVDTDVFCLLFVLRGSSDSRIPRWRELLTGRPILISFQTRAELLGGALADGRGERRMSELRAISAGTPTIPADIMVMEAYTTVFAECRRLGHALQGPKHTGDRWVAASAVAKGAALLSGDGIYDGAPGVVLLR